jgi:hypothetical protein
MSSKESDFQARVSGFFKGVNGNARRSSTNLVIVSSRTLSSNAFIQTFYK